MSITFQCKCCGAGLEFEKGATITKCEYCGIIQTLPKLDDDRRKGLYARANYFRQNGDFDKAMIIYEQILSEDNTDSEAYWSLVLCRYGVEYVEDPATHKRVPTVNRTQPLSIISDKDYKTALNYADDSQIKIYKSEAQLIDKIQREILEISRREKPFDVFISYKDSDNTGQRTPDSVMAVDLYERLTNEGLKVFCSRITLEDKIGQKYEPYIFAALNSAPVMIVLGTRPEYFNAVWVRNEWSRFLNLIKNGAKKTLIPAFKDMSPYELPDEFSHLQAQDMGKIGAMQDLIRGVKKLIRPKNEAIIFSGSQANSAPLLKRAFMFLEDGDFENAGIYCERVLDIDPENAAAYLAKLMVEKRVKSRSDLANCAEPFDNSNNYKNAIRFGDAGLIAELEGYIANIQTQIRIELENRVKKKRKFIRIFCVVIVITLAIFLHVLYKEYITIKLIGTCVQGDIQGVINAINNGADINTKDEYGETVLMSAAWFGHSEIVKVLIKAGADVNIKDTNGKTALIYAASHGNAESIKALIKAGADMNVKDIDGDTALTKAAYFGNTQTLNILIKAGANLNAKNNDGNTALIFAANNGNTEIINTLLNAGADVKIRNRHNNMAISYIRGNYRFLGTDTLRRLEQLSR